MAQGSLVAERETPLRSVLLLIAGIFIVLLVSGYLWLFTPPKKSISPAVARLKTQGLALYREKKYEQAVGRLSRYAKAAPKDWQVREALAQVYWQLGDGERALAELSAVDTLVKPDGDRLYRMGLIAGQLGREGAAVNYLRRSLKLKPKSMLVRVELAKLFAKSERFDESIALWQEAIELLPQKDLYAAVLYAELGDVQRLKGDSEKAKEAYRRGLEIEPGNAYLQAQVAATGGP